MIVDYLFIYFKVAFNQDYLTYASNLVTSAKLLGSLMNCDPYHPDSTKVGNTFFSSFTTALNILCKNYPILFSGISAPFH